MDVASFFENAEITAKKTRISLRSRLPAEIAQLSVELGIAAIPYLLSSKYHVYNRSIHIYEQPPALRYLNYIAQSVQLVRLPSMPIFCSGPPVIFRAGE